MQCVTLKIGALAYGGAFVGEVLDADSPLKGKKAFIREVCPGETVAAEVIADKRSYVEAALRQVSEVSADRVLPPCPYFECCGGCDLQHLTLAAQREAKRRMVEDTLRMQGGLTAGSGVSLCGEDLPPFFYRRRIALHLNRRGELGFYQPNSGVVVPIAECLLAAQPINQCLARLRTVCGRVAEWVGGVVIEMHADDLFVLLKLHDQARWNEVRAQIQGALREAAPNINVIEGKREHVLSRNFKRASDDTLPIGHFSQVNERANALLIELVCAAVSCGQVTEFYAGAGNLSLPLAKKGARVTAVEVDRALVNYGKERAARAGLSSAVTFVQRSAEDYVRTCRVHGAVVLDPPRAGAKNVVRTLSPREAPQIVYVSCSLPSLTRDLKVLAANGYLLEHVHVLDMFPQTHHVENVALLVAA